MATIATHTTEPAVDAVRHHYEVGNEFYRLLLGSSMMYSGGYWEQGEGLVEALDIAQERKLDVFADLAEAAGKDRVLDIGCGWGTLAHRLTTKHGVREAVGLTLSRTQAAYIADLGNPAITTRVESWSEHHAPGASTLPSASTPWSTSCPPVSRRRSAPSATASSSSRCTRRWCPTAGSCCTR
ncbi:SAM-dependent methyltransferase [Streptomyces sp. NPDC020490]|uniref:SAM-dependent methyltransferase n=1 Tax=Streptomyces sp. NPDC020490 TaxID=3365078 RepID=UPI0037BDAA57